MAEKERSIVPGALLILIGVVLLIHQLGIFYLRWHHFYPIIMLGLSGVLFMSIFTKGDKSSAFLATIVFILGLFFLMRNFGVFSMDYYFYDFTEFWPIFLIAFGTGFLVLYFFKPDDWGVLIPGGVLLLFGVIFLLRNLGIFYLINLADFWPIILIAIGMSLVIGSLRRKPQ